MTSKTKSIISLTLFGLSILCLALGFVMLFLQLNVVVGIVSAFLTGVVCFVVGCLLFPRNVIIRQETIEKPVRKQTTSFYYQTCTNDNDKDDDWDEEEKEEEERRRQEEEEEEEEFMMYEDDNL